MTYNVFSGSHFTSLLVGCRIPLRTCRIPEWRWLQSETRRHSAPFNPRCICVINQAVYRTIFRAVAISRGHISVSCYPPAERGGCFLFVRLLVCLFVCQHDNFRTIRRWNLADCRCTVQKSHPSSNLGVKGQRPKVTRDKKNKKCGIFSEVVLWRAVLRQLYAGGKISACCLVQYHVYYRIISLYVLCTQQLSCLSQWFVEFSTGSNVVCASFVLVGSG